MPDDNWESQVGQGEGVATGGTTKEMGLGKRELEINVLKTELVAAEIRSREFEARAEMLGQKVEALEGRPKPEWPKLYIGTRLIRAEPMDAMEFQIQFGSRGLDDLENAPGYKVIYPDGGDGYVSWSPKAPFEAAYREVTDLERGIL